MEKYKNLSGDSPVYAYRIAEDRIHIQYHDGGIYLYTNSVTGPENVARMKELAIHGQGLSTYISQHVKKRYASKLR